jgi:hypothetical protein
MSQKRQRGKSLCFFTDIRICKESCGCPNRKCRCRVLKEIDLPGHPAKGQGHDRNALGKLME